MRGFFFKYNGKMNTEYDVTVVKRPNRPSPKREYETVKIDGRDGNLYEDHGTYEDIDILVQMNFTEEPDKWNEKTRRIRRWLTDAEDDKLIFSDDMEYFYKVKKVSIGDVSRSMKRIGRFDVTFTCEPYMYLVQGENIVDVSGVMVNMWDEAKPTYYVFGNGKMTLKINKKTVQVEVEKSLTIDTQLGLCYGAGNDIRNTAMSGEYEDMYLQHGDNTVEVSWGFVVLIRPNWRSI